MSNENKKKNTYTKDMIINEISRERCKSKRLVKEVYDAIEDKIFDLLSSVDDDNNVSIRLFEGIVFDGTYVPEHEKKNNLTGEMIIAKGKIVPKVKITRTYCNKINAD